jgi:hypothetical protein
MSDINALLKQIDEAHARLLAAFEGFDAIILETEPIAGSWSARDITGHLTDWGYEIIAAAEHVLGGPAPRGQPIPDGEAFNVMSAALRGAEPWDVTQADFRAMWGASMQLLGRLEERDLRRIGRMPWGEVGPVEKFFAVIPEHIHEHLEDIDAWRVRKLGLNPRDRRR